MLTEEIGPRGNAFTPCRTRHRGAAAASLNDAPTPDDSVSLQQLSGGDCMHHMEFGNSIPPTGRLRPRPSFSKLGSHVHDGHGEATACRSRSHFSYKVAVTTFELLVASSWEYRGGEDSYAPRSKVRATDTGFPTRHACAFGVALNAQVGLYAVSSLVDNSTYQLPLSTSCLPISFSSTWIGYPHTHQAQHYGP